MAVVIARLFKPAIRAVVVDLDDTLWGGLVGEVGPEGVELDPDGLGRSYLELQQFLQDVSDRGVPIAVVSKNDDDQARRPFNERPEMVLSLDSVVNFAASWRPKYEAIAALAEKLNIGLDSICFLDDSLLERDEARRMLPGLIVPELPAAPGKRVEFLIRSRLFTAPVISEEDRGRVEYYKQSLQVVPENLDGYLESLEMVLEPLAIDQTNRERVLSLLHKTNQFNVTLWRPTPGELNTFLDSHENYAYAFRLNDRLGDAGIIAVVLAQPDGPSCRLTAWVMSCRVFGRGVEHATAEHLCAWLNDREFEAVEVPFVEGPRNSLVPAVLTSLGLQPDPGDVEPVIYSGRTMTIPHHHLAISGR
jgi:FkbH-like protein